MAIGHVAVDGDVVSVEYVDDKVFDIVDLDVEVTVSFVVEDIDINVGDERVGVVVDEDNNAVEALKVDFTVGNVDVDFVCVEDDHNDEDVDCNMAVDDFNDVDDSFADDATGILDELNLSVW